MKVQLNKKQTLQMNTDVITVEMESYQRLVNLKCLMRDENEIYFPYFEEIEKVVLHQINKLKFDLGDKICVELEAKE